MTRNMGYHCVSREWKYDMLDIMPSKVPMTPSRCRDEDITSDQCEVVFLPAGARDLPCHPRVSKLFVHVHMTGYCIYCGHGHQKAAIASYTHRCI
jgi:hypothetical protein